MASTKKLPPVRNDTVDLLVIGSGIAGCAAALAAADRNVQVTVITRAENIESSNTERAQGGIIYRGKGDSPDLLVNDVIEAGCGICHEPAVRRLATEGPELVKEILIERLKVPFDRRGASEDLTEEGAHSIPRIIHAEDRTGQAIEHCMARAIERHPNIRILKRATAVDLLTFSHHSRAVKDRYASPTCFGAYVLDQKTGRIGAVKARETVLATGGLGYIYQYTTNPPGARGDGVAMAYRAGARLLNLEYIQFHPTALYHRDARGFLISESMRGEGAELLTATGQAFMKRYHRRGSLAPRDIVARAIHDIMLRENEPCVYLDISNKPAAWIRKRFPQIHGKCMEVGIDCTKQPIPVVPAAHYACGGVSVDLEGRATIGRLWAAGEVSCTGVHGANRLASTSLLEGLVWGHTAGLRIAENCASSEPCYIPEVAPWQREKEAVDPALIRQDWMTIKSTMWNYAGLVRSYRMMRRARRILRELQLEVDDFYRRGQLTDEMLGLRNGLQTALAVLYAAMENRQSYGSHYRID
ncbi:MAG: L-aspartate oxidase [Candidatus Sumerlaeota bacterium]|nr:L-aspartate oxidase [Candidatus Sumerlaeota bacterium]